MHPRISWELGAHFWNHCHRSYMYLINSTLQAGGQHCTFFANQFVQYRHLATCQLTVTKQTINVITVQTTTMRHSWHPGLLRIITAMDTHQQHGQHMLASTILSTYAFTITNNRKTNKNSYWLTGFDGFALKTPGCFDYKRAKPNMTYISRRTLTR